MSETKEDNVDYLDVDDSIPGQNYVCLSFVSPEALIEKREAFNVCKFLQSYCKDQELDYKELYSKYEDFTYKFSDKLQRDFDEQNEFQTSMRGLKVRGVYDTRQAAEARAKRLSTTDSSFHVFIGQVGYWLPWDPNADGVQDEVFQNSQLNDMMEKYQENNVNRDIFYEEQKREKVKAAREEALKKKREQQEEKTLELADAEEEPDGKGVVEEVLDGVEKVVEGAEEVKEGVDEIEDAVKEAASETVKEVHKVDEDIKKSLESVDPWLANKLQQEPSTEQVVEPEPEVVEPEPEPVEDC